MKSIFGIVVVATALATQTSGGRWELPADLKPKTPAREAVLAKANGQSILMADVEPFLWEWRRKEVVLDLVESDVVDAAAKKAGFAASETEIQDAMDNLLNDLQRSLPPDQPIQRALDERGLGPSRLWLRVRKEVLLRKLVLKDHNPADWVRASTIVVRPVDKTAAELRKALEAAEKISKRLKSGESWETLVSEKGGGSIGWRPLSVFPESVRAELKSPSVKVSSPVQTENGIQLFRIDARGQGASADERADLENTVFQARRNRVMEELKKAAGVEIAPWAKTGKPSLVFASSKYVGKKYLDAPLSFALYGLETG